jgi:hypothetical protein
MMSAFVTEAIGDSISLPVKLLLTTCDQAVRSQSMPLIHRHELRSDVPDRNSILAAGIGARGQRRIPRSSPPFSRFYAEIPSATLADGQTVRSQLLSLRHILLI